NGAIYFKVEGECGYSSCPQPLEDHINVHLVPHTHDDVGWLKTVDQYYYGARNDIQRAGVQYIIDSVVESLLKDPSRRFIYVESAFLWRWWGEQDLEMKETVRELVNEGRLELVSGGWSMNDEAAAHYSAVIDNMALGIKFLQDEFGDCGRPKVGWQIDPFGHSKEYANILAKFGFDGLFLGRIDYADKIRRKTDKNLEMVWKAGKEEGSGEGDIFTGINYNTYGPPPGFCFDSLCTDVIMDNKLMEDYNLDEKIASFINLTYEQTGDYKTNNIMMTMGEDFQYQEANMWYKNLDKLIKYMNQNKTSHKIHLMYSTPSCYLKSVNNANVSLLTKTDDFFPYASDPDAYWSGYFTSRPALKGMIRKANTLLQACKQVESFNIDSPEDPRLAVAKRSVAVNQHHDAVTGTAKQHVTDDYYLSLYRGMQACHQIIADGVMQETGASCNFNEWCPMLNVSQCLFTESRNSFTAVVYNPSATNRTFPVRIPVLENKEYTILDEMQNQVEYQIVPIPKPVLLVPGQLGEARFELVLMASVPGLTSRVFGFSKLDTEYRGTKTLKLKSGKWRGLSVENDNIKVYLSENGNIENIKVEDQDINMKQSFEWYEPAVGDNSEYTRRASGAYIFRPNGTKTILVGDPTSATLLKGSLVQEIHQVYSPWLSQVIRVYKDSSSLEFEWMVGPIPIEDGGKEIITKYKTDLVSDDIFYTDSNGRGLIKRQRDHRETWDLNLTEPVAANYYPVNSRIGISDDSDASLWILPDRSEGGSSLSSGEIELMIHRRLLHDDAFGVGEALNETAFGEGLVVRGKHSIVLCGTNCDDESARKAEEIFAAPVILFGEACGPNSRPVSPDVSKLHAKFNAKPRTSINLPDYIKLLTMEKWTQNQILVRLENILSDVLESYTVHVQDLFPGKPVSKIQEMTLDGNRLKSQVKRMDWIHESNSIPNLKHKNIFTRDSVDEVDGLDVVLEPGSIKTIMVYF
ncbi:lysosomal alpha-mannosidase, partial [Eurytemora carolleeae]|uniref:lysosomal alpha-mannosidase n=1 Tax=Eurytemora carolleeae TaxID=1294199 RepID=UPI000C777447